MKAARTRVRVKRWKDNRTHPADPYIQPPIPNLWDIIKKFEPPTYPLVPAMEKFGCHVCGMKFDGAMGYVCPNDRCPGRITSHGITYPASTKFTVWNTNGASI